MVSGTRALTGRTVVDSNTFTYLVDAMASHTERPVGTSGVEGERRAMFRIYIYDAAPLCVVPTVKEEYCRIRDIDLLRFHEVVGEVVLLDGPWAIDTGERSSRVATLRKHHASEEDCRVLAEAEQIGADRLLTFDGDFRNRLAPVARGVSLKTPAQYLQELRIEPGAAPVRMPAPGNPRSRETWWRL